jgi:hypothetical protein
MYYQHLIDAYYQHLTDCWPTVGHLLADCLSVLFPNPVGCLSNNSRPTDGGQMANSRLTDGRQVFLGAVLHNYQKGSSIFQGLQMVDKQEAIKTHVILRQIV